MRTVNLIIFCVLFGMLFIWIGRNKWKKKGKILWYIEKYIWVIFILLLANIFSFCASYREEQMGNRIDRNDYLGNEKEVNILLRKDNEEQSVSLTVMPRQYDDQEREKKMQEAFTYIEKQMLGENESFEHITKNLNVQLDTNIYPFTVQIIPEHYLLLDEEGVVRNEKEQMLDAGFTQQEIANGIPTTFTIELSYGEFQKEKSYDIRIFEKEKTDLETEFSDVEKQLVQTEKDTVLDQSFLIPSMIDGIEIKQKDTDGISSAGILILGGVIAICLVIRKKEQARKLEQERENNLRFCYPWFVNEMLLLLGAGMQVKNIILTLIDEYEEERKNGEDERLPLMEELYVAKHHFEMGMPEQQVYFQLGRQLKLTCYIKLMTMLEQNVKKGTRGLTDYFEREEREALEERKNLARRFGEEAGTKLLGPMMLQLLVVMLIIMVPALMSF